MQALLPEIKLSKDLMRLDNLYSLPQKFLPVHLILSKGYQIAQAGYQICLFVV